MLTRMNMLPCFNVLSSSSIFRTQEITASEQLVCRHWAGKQVGRHQHRTSQQFVMNQRKSRQLSMSTRNRRNSRGEVDQIEVGPYRLCGLSIAAVETCMWLPSLSLAIDSGRSPSGAIPMKFMAITHGHSDHVHGLPLHAATRSLQRMEPATYFVPNEIADDVRALVSAVSKLERAELHANIVSMSPEDPPVSLSRGRYLRAFHTTHTVPSQGYIVYNKHKKLSPEYAGMSRQEIITLKKDGVAVEEESLVPEIAFTGDTTLDAIAQCEDCRNARVVVTEMTFLNSERSAEHARSLGHVHFDDVVANKHLFDKNECVVFSHFSARYSTKEIQSALESLPEDLRKKTVALGARDPANLKNVQ